MCWSILYRAIANVADVNLTDIKNFALCAHGQDGPNVRLAESYSTSFQVRDNVYWSQDRTWGAIDNMADIWLISCIDRIENSAGFQVRDNVYWSQDRTWGAIDNMAATWLISCIDRIEKYQ